MTNLNEISSPVWSLSLTGYGLIVEGIDAIRQQMDIALRTTKGTDPLRPEFGSNVYKYQDAPITVAVPNIKRELLQCLGLWVRAIKVIAIKHYLRTPSNPVFEIYFRLVDDTTIERLVFDINSGVIAGINSDLIISGIFTPGLAPAFTRYQATLLLNGTQAMPLPPPTAFATTSDLFAWILVNYGYVGRWHLLADRIICYVTAPGITSGELKITLLPITVFGAKFPEKAPTQNYWLTFKVNGIDAVPPVPWGITGYLDGFNTQGEALLWAQTNWGTYATWSIEYLLSGTDPIFDDEFSDEFDVIATGYILTGFSHIPGNVYEFSITTIL